MISEKEYYEIMGNMCDNEDFETLHKNWHICFEYILKDFKCGFTKKAIDSLFYNFAMKNWEELWLETSTYKGSSKDELIKSFGYECSYICDRTSYDRLFRTHWLFIKAFDDEMDEMQIK